MYNQFRGTGVALVTPFKNGAVDFDGLENVINHVIEGGVDYLVSLGTTGETPTLSAAEQIEVLDFTIKVNNDRVPVVAGFGGNNTAQIVESIKSYHFKGVAAILSSSPAYNKPTQEGLFQHFMAIATASPVPIILYNVPGRTAKNMTAATTLRLAHASKKFIAIKEASGDLVQCMEIVQEKPDGFLVVSGDDIITLPMLGFGMDGVISVISNALPKPFTTMVNLGLQGDFKAAQALHFDLLKTTQLLFAENNPAGVKGALKILGICDDEVRLPVVRLTEGTYAALEKEVIRINNEL